MIFSAAADLPLLQWYLHCLRDHIFCNRLRLPSAVVPVSTAEIAIRTIKGNQLS
jgi:hypothetical protein